MFGHAIEMLLALPPIVVAGLLPGAIAAFLDNRGEPPNEVFDRPLRVEFANRPRGTKVGAGTIGHKADRIAYAYSGIRSYLLNDCLKCFCQASGVY